MRNYEFKTVDEALPVLCHDLLEGDEIGSRLGERTMELPFTTITLTEPWKREVVSPARKANVAAQIAETMWVLAGRNDVEWLSNYLPRAADFSDDGETWRGAYGPRLRGNYAYGVDQLQHVFDLMKTDPRTRRAVISIYDPAIDTEPGKDIPCNDFITFLSRLGRLDMHVTVRSNDLIWGWSGINTFEWSVLQEILAHMLGLEIGNLHFSITSLHLYDRHWAKAERIYNENVATSSGSIRYNGPHTIGELDWTIEQWFRVEDLIRTGFAQEDDVNRFPEPMMRSWLRVIQWYWSGDESFLTPLWNRTKLSALAGVKPKGSVILSHTGESDTVLVQDYVGDVIREDVVENKSFSQFVSELHAEKHKAYGDSWKRRGEMLGIMANIARKIDRLGASTEDETAADTAIDLMVYLVKYRWWLAEFEGCPDPAHRQVPNPTDHTEPVDTLIQDLKKGRRKVEDPTDLEKELTDQFDILEGEVKSEYLGRYRCVDAMLRNAYDLASWLRWKEQNKTRIWKGYEQP